MAELAIAVASFVLTHFILSHPLRAPIVARVGEKGFLGLYSLVAFATLIWAVMAYRAAPIQQLWLPPLWILHAGALLMLVASILFAGSFLAPNPAMVEAGKVLSRSTEPKGVMGITRHPMMWAFGLWAVVHVASTGRLETLILAGGIGILALVGAWFQDGKKAAQLGDGWAAYAARTSYWPLGAQLSGRLSWSRIWPGILPVGLGIALYIILVVTHPLVIGKSTGVMAWN
ncbi:NnrU family protein [Sphingosinicella soli]|uniref:Putative membrane protein n=1 Tax=Sphingosinicella soli TaxID=333708 RepID=A0A7W7F8Z5_9SPHN|nr:NnrU family protein [Sphingosinicella soli]MBB4632153.1 putative membrane protein [Sphingosinicella soli]